MCGCDKAVTSCVRRAGEWGRLRRSSLPVCPLRGALRRRMSYPSPFTSFFLPLYVCAVVSSDTMRSDYVRVQHAQTTAFVALHYRRCVCDSVLFFHRGRDIMFFTSLYIYDEHFSCNIFSISISSILHNNIICIYIYYI